MMEHIISLLAHLPAIPPAWILMVGACLLPLLRPLLLRQLCLLILPIGVFVAIWAIPSTIGFTRVPLAEFALNFYTIHPYTKLFASAFTLVFFAGALFSLQNARVTELTAATMLAGAAIGATYSGNLISFFLYWEIMAVASIVIIACGNSERATQAAIRYGLLHFTGGAILLAGIIGISMHGTAQFTLHTISMEFLSSFSVYDKEQLSILLILIGVLINAAALPFAAWLPDSYPESSPTGMVFLSAFTTKTAIFILLTLFAGSELLIPIGIVMVLYGLMYALLENDIRRMLAYSMVNQLGFMVCGIGIGTPLALNGVAILAFCHIIYKALLIMVAGSIIIMSGKQKFSELGGLHPSMKLTALFGMIGALSIAAFPLTSGFISKSMLIDAAAAEHLRPLWLLLIAASAGSLLYAAKFLWFVFFGTDSGLRPAEPPLPMKLAMGLLSILCLLPGLAPQWLYLLLPQSTSYAPYTAHHLISQLELLFFAAAAFFLILPLLKPSTTISLDVDWLYRVFLKRLLLLAGKFIDFIGEQLRSLTIVLVAQLKRKNIRSGATQTIGFTLGAALMLLGILLIHYFGLGNILKTGFQ